MVVSANSYRSAVYSNTPALLLAKLRTFLNDCALHVCLYAFRVPTPKTLTHKREEILIGRTRPLQVLS